MFIQDVRLAVRQLPKSPGFVLAVTLTLALGIGVNTAVFTLVNAFLLRPLPYPEPDRLAVLVLHREGISSKSGQFVQNEDTSQDGETWELVRDNVPAVHAASFGGTSGVNLQAGSAAGNSVRYLQDMRVSAHYFEVLGIQPSLGRGFTEQEDRPNGPNAVILSYATWQSVFHGDAQVLGSEIRLKSLTAWLGSYPNMLNLPEPRMYSRHSSLTRAENAEETIARSSCAWRRERRGSKSCLLYTSPSPRD